MRVPRDSPFPLSHSFDHDFCCRGFPFFFLGPPVVVLSRYLWSLLFFLFSEQGQPFFFFRFEGLLRPHTQALDTVLSSASPPKSFLFPHGVFPSHPISLRVPFLNERLSPYNFYRLFFKFGTPAAGPLTLPRCLIELFPVADPFQPLVSPSAPVPFEDGISLDCLGLDHFPPRLPVFFSSGGEVNLFSCFP